MRIKPCFSLLLSVCLVLSCSIGLIGTVSAAEKVSAFTRCKTGIAAVYMILADGKVALSNGATTPAIPPDTAADNPLATEGIPS